MPTDTLPAIRSRIEALTNRLASTMTVTEEEIADLRTVLALLAGPGEEEARSHAQKYRDGPSSVHEWAIDAAALLERLAVRLEAETRAREELIEAARAVDATWMTVHGIGPQANENVGAAFNAACMDLHNVLRREIAR